MRKIQTLCLIINTVDELFFPVIKRNLTTIEDFLRKNEKMQKNTRTLNIIRRSIVNLLMKGTP